MGAALQGGHGQERQARGLHGTWLASAALAQTPPPSETSGNEVLEGNEPPEEGGRLSPTPASDASGAPTGDEDDGLHPASNLITPTHTGPLVTWAQAGTPVRAIPEEPPTPRSLGMPTLRRSARINPFEN